MKILKKHIILFIFCITIYFSVYVFIQNLFDGNKSVDLLGESYVLYDALDGNFTPFGSEYLWFQTDESSADIFGISYYKSDKNKNFLYKKDVLDTFVYKKDKLIIPNMPEIDFVDELIILYNNTKIVVTDKNDADILLNYLSKNDFSGEMDKDDEILFFAVSKYYSGIFQLNRDGSIYFTDSGEIGYGEIITGTLPKNIQEIIRLYIVGE